MPSSEEYLAPSYKNKKRNLGKYAAPVLTLLFVILVIVYLSGQGTKKPDEEAASLAETQMAREETVLKGEVVARQGPEGEALSEMFSEKITLTDKKPPSSSEASPDEPEIEESAPLAYTQKAKEETVTPGEAFAKQGPEGEDLSQVPMEEITIPDKKPESGPETSPGKPAQPVKIAKPQPVREKQASLLIELGPEEDEIAMSAVDTPPQDSKLHVVQKGDTLWHIAKRFTGNPFIYPRIAKDSDIRNPDLIYPGQKVIIRYKGVHN